MCEKRELKKGDIVTRDGTDEHLVFSENEGYGNIDVVCIKEPHVTDGNGKPWISIGEIETNLERRYNFLRKSTNMNDLLKIIGREDLIK